MFECSCHLGQEKRKECKFVCSCHLGVKGKVKIVNWYSRVILIKRKERNVSGYALNVRWYALNVRWYASVALVRRKVRNAVILIFVQVCILILFARKYIIKFIRTKHYNCVSSNSKNLENFQSSIV